MNKHKFKEIEEVSKQEEYDEQYRDIIDILFDEKNTEPLILVDQDGKKLKFEQIAVIPFNEKIYCILKPIDKIGNVQDDEAIIFFVDDEEGKSPALMVETNEKIMADVFDEYYKLLDEPGEK